jgi:hypothetical protein
MDKGELSKYRAEVIERFINIEWMINAIISQYYLKKVIKPFILEVLYDEYFSFALRRRILEKILKKTDKYDSNIMNNLYRLNTIRNYFAHCGQEFIDFSDKELKGRIIDPKDTEKELDFASLHREFMEKAGEIEKYLVKRMQDLGVSLITELPQKGQ